MRTFANPAARRDPGYAGLFTAEDYREVEAFYSTRETLAATPLRVLPGLAASLGIGALLVKDESQRFGLEAFKSTGATFAMHKLDRAELQRGVVCATAGNHGRAVARAARDARVPCTVYVPAAGAQASPAELAVRVARVNAMRRDGAEIVEATGSYEEAVAQAEARAASSGAVLLSDTASNENDPIARSIMLGYTHVFAEAARQWPAAPDVVIVQGGVGGLVAAAASWFAFHFGSRRPRLLACEPETHDCLLASAQAGHAVDLDDLVRSSPSDRHNTIAPLPTIMAGLRCSRPSAAAWPAVRDGIDGFVAIPDAVVHDAIARLAHPGAGDPPITAGPSGACGVAALLALMAAAGRSTAAELGRLDRSTSVLAIVTEGA